jgi:HEXXH motif-containing protein
MTLDWEAHCRPTHDLALVRLARALAKAQNAALPEDPPVAGVPLLSHTVSAYVLPEWNDCDHFVDAALDHPVLFSAIDLLAVWPAALAEVGLAIRVVHPRVHVAAYFDTPPVYHVPAACHSLESLFDAVGVSVHCPLTCAEGIVHELAHQKLRALGVHCDRLNAGLVLNSPDDLVASPFRDLARRPISAVFHGVYAYLHVVQLDQLVHREGHQSGFLDQRTAQNLARLSAGFAILEGRLRLDPVGTSFWAGLTRWFHELRSAGSGRGDA